MEDKLARYQEIYARGLQDKLPADKRAIAEELIKRGVLQVQGAEMQQQQAPPAPMPQQPAPQQQTLGQAAQSVLAPLPSREFSDPKYWTENVPQSAARLPVAVAAGMGGMAYEAAKEFTDPFMNLLDSPKEALLDYRTTASDLFYAPNLNRKAQGVYGKAIKGVLSAPKRAAAGVLHGMKEFAAAPLGLGTEQTASQAWDDPAASLLALSPFIKPGLKIAKGAIPKEVGLNLTRKSLQFAPSIDPVVQKKVAATVRKGGANITESGLDKFVGDLKAKNQAVSNLVEPVADTPIDLDLGAAFKNRIVAAEVSGTKGKDIKQAKKYFEGFRRDHLVDQVEVEQGGQKQIVEVPKELTLGKVQKLKQNINFQLKNYWKEKAKSGKSNDAKAEAMQAVGDLLRREVEKYVPETKQLNREISDMVVARPFLQSAVNKVGSRQAISYRDLMAGGVAGTVVSPTASVPAIIASKILRDPRTKGGAGIALYNLGEFASKVKKMLTPREAESIVAELEPQLPPQAQRQLPPGITKNRLRLPPGAAKQKALPRAWPDEVKLLPDGQGFEMRDVPPNPLALPMPERGFTMRNSEEVYSSYTPPEPLQNQLAIGSHRTGQRALPAPVAPEMVPSEISAFERLFQIAQSPEGKRLLVERLGREEKHAKLVSELLKVPTTKALPPGGQFTMQEPIGPAPAPRPTGAEIRYENQLSSGGR